jgi:hypothetical protein
VNPAFLLIAIAAAVLVIAVSLFAKRQTAGQRKESNDSGSTIGMTSDSHHASRDTIDAQGSDSGGSDGGGDGGGGD